MEKRVDLRGISMNETASHEAENILNEMEHGKISFILNSSAYASCVALVAYKLGWEMKLDYREDCFTIMLHKEKEMEKEICA